MGDARESDAGAGLPNIVFVRDLIFGRLLFVLNKYANSPPFAQSVRISVVLAN